MATRSNKLSHTEIETLAQLRDELSVQMHLAKADAKDLWAKLEGDWNKLQSEVKHVSSAANRSAQDVGAASELLFSSIKEGYQKIKQSLPKT